LQHPTAAAGIGDLYAADRDWERAIAEYDKALTRGTLDDVLAKRAAAYEATGRWKLAVADWLQVARRRPDLAQAAYDRLIGAARWSEAMPLGMLRIEQKPADSTFWLRFAPILVLAGDEADYPAYCRRMAKQFAESQLPEEHEKTIKVCLLRPGLIDLAKPASVRLSRYLDSGAEPGWLRPFAWCGRALLAYRNGDSTSAIEYAAKSRELGCVDEIQALNLTVVAMARHRLRQPEEARRTFDEASQLMARLEVDPAYRVNADVLIARIVLGEAEALINGKLQPNPTRGKTVPAGAARGRSGENSKNGDRKK
jgi:tetratricopeptide (TPR) repeat protein